jgi:hypothetical protein
VKGAWGPSGQVVIEKTISGSTVQREKTRSFESAEVFHAGLRKKIAAQKTEGGSRQSEAGEKTQIKENQETGKAGGG